MTIYNVIDNYKDFGHQPESSAIHWALLSGASILQGGNPFFVPGFANRFEARPTVALRIGKLGKNIAPRFAYRYIDRIAPCVNFTAADFLEKLRNDGLPWTQAVNFDRSAAFGTYEEFGPDSIQDTTVAVRVFEKGNIVGEKIWKSGELIVPIEDVLHLISEENTLKTGDIILAGITTSGPEVAIGQRIELSLGDKVSVIFNIR